MPTKKTPADSIVVLQTSIGFDLVIRSNPTDDEVRSFVEAQSEYVIYNAKRHPSELIYLDGDSWDAPEIDLSVPVKKSSASPKK